MSSQRQLTEYLKGYAGQHKPTTINVYIAIHAFIGLPDGARPSVKTIADMAGVSRRTVNDAVEVLVAAGVLRVDSRRDGHGRPLPNRYTLLPISGNRPRSLEVQPLAVSAETCGGGTSSTDRYVLEEPVLDSNWGLDLATQGFPEPPAAASVQIPGIPREFGQGLAAGETHDLESLGEKPEALGDLEEIRRPGRRSIFQEDRGDFGAAPTGGLDDFKKPLADPDQEQSAVDILELLDKLRVHKLNVRPLSAGSRPGQMTSARLLVAHNRVNVTELLDAMRWAFSEPGSARGWPERLPKVYVLRGQLEKLLEAYRRALVADISGDALSHAEAIEERSPEQLSGLRRRLEEFR
jgi:hypothetical protein